jgi:uncharacterized protein (TIGR03067 family)
MNTALLLALAVGAPALKDKPPAELSIEGEWQVVKRFDAAKPSTDSNRWIFSPGGVAEIRNSMAGDVVSDLTYTVSADGPVKSIDFQESQGNGRYDPRPGIYKIEGDTLTVSFKAGSGPRPTTFDPTADNYVLVLKRVRK